MVAGESMFMANYTALKQNAMVAFGTTVPGNIMTVDLANLPSGIVLQKALFYARRQALILVFYLLKDFHQDYLVAKDLFYKKQREQENYF